MAALKAAPEQEQEVAQGITGITVAGYKSIREEQHIEVRPLTILAGANSSGKSSIMQPLLLLKQTLEAPFDPGPLWLGGPNVEFTSVEQLLSRGANTLRVEIQTPGRRAISILFSYERLVGLRIQEVEYMSYLAGQKQRVPLREGMTSEELTTVMKPIFEADSNMVIYKILPGWSVVRDRWKLQLEGSMARDIGDIRDAVIKFTSSSIGPLHDPSHLLYEMIHVRGLRGSPERNYPVTAMDKYFPGRFEPYVAGIITQWQASGNNVKLDKLAEDLKRLDLTSSISADRLNDTQVELQVGRLPTQATRSKKADMVNIADVGFGVSQALPVLVALHVAKPGQMVYLEQPEIHLHPRAQWEMAHVLAEAANRGVHVVVETHSSLLLLGIQTLVAQDVISREKVKLHWFTRNSAGNTEIKSADLTETGGFGDWPENFADVSLSAQIEYLNAADVRAQSR
jgi:predicted ATPase